jgi:hypothetical protein
VRKIIIAAVFIISSLPLFAQSAFPETPDVIYSEQPYALSDSREDDVLMNNLDNAFSNKNMYQLESYLASVVTLRIEDNLYQNIVNSQAVELIAKYMESKEDVTFIKMAGKSAKLNFVENGQKKSVYVDYPATYTGKKIAYLNISNRPSATAFTR